ncbi:MAG TPA: serine hydrolase domain-containing protein [Bacteroidia bacterium]|nr:serine hydrolase domain-containing protein [Bacteroidia bacterium]
MKQLNSLFILLVVIFFSQCKKEEIVPTTSIECVYADSSASHPKYTVYNELLERYRKKGLPGISILINDSNGTWIGSSGFADIDKGIKFSPCHISKAASITKLLVGSMVLKLQEQGKININDPISKYIDDDILKKIKNSDGKTIKQLMNHTTGIFDVITAPAFYLAVINNPNKTWSFEDLLQFVYNKDGETLSAQYPANYSNTNTLLLVMCVEKATGEKHEKLLRDLILTPLGMNSTFYQGRKQIPSDAAQGYFDLHSNGTIVNVSNYITGSGNGYGGVYSNVFDLFKFMDALFAKKTLLSQASLDLMTEFNREDDDLQYA